MDTVEGTARRPGTREFETCCRAIVGEQVLLLKSLRNTATYPRNLNKKYSTMTYPSRAVPGLILICFALLLPTSIRADDFQEARRLFQQGSYSQALERVDAVLVKQPKDARARFLRGLIFTEQSRFPEAIRVFTALTEDYPELPEPYNNLAVIYASQGQDEKARQALEMAIRTHPTYATAHENLGDIYAKMARQAYDKALQLDASNASAKAKLALVKELFSTRASVVAPVKGTIPEPPVPSPAVVAAGPVSPVVSAPASATPAPAKPEPPAAASASPPPKAGEASRPKEPADPQAEVLRALDQWVKAWSSGDANAYLGAYAPGFKPPGGQSRTEWERSRRERVVKGKRIAVQALSPKVSFAGPEEAVVTFRQNYQSDTLKTIGSKRLVMVRSAGRWLIQREELGR